MFHSVQHQVLSDFAKFRKHVFGVTKILLDQHDLQESNNHRTISQPGQTLRPIPQVHRMAQTMIGQSRIIVVQHHLVGGQIRRFHRKNHNERNDRKQTTLGRLHTSHYEKLRSLYTVDIERLSIRR